MPPILGSSRLLAALAAAALCLPAVAERADRYKPTNVEADRMQYDDQKQVNVFTGNVVLTKGTITIRGDRLVVRQDPEGFQHGTANGRPATFRQKRDGGDEWIDGEADELYYDGKTETVRLTRNAKVRRTEGTRTVDNIEGALIVYDTRSEQLNVDGAVDRAAGGTGGRVRVTINPRVTDPAAAPAPAPGGAGGTGASAAPARGTPLQPAQRLSGPRPGEPR